MVRALSRERVSALRARVVEQARGEDGRMRWRVSAEKNVSTAFNQEPDVGVKWKVQRGWRASQAFTLGCLCVA